MSLTEELHQSAVEHLAESRLAMEKLLSVSDDAMTKTIVDCDFTRLEETIQEYGRCQLQLR